MRYFFCGIFALGALTLHADAAEPVFPPTLSNYEVAAPLILERISDADDVAVAGVFQLKVDSECTLATQKTQFSSYLTGKDGQQVSADFRVRSRIGQTNEELKCNAVNVCTGVRKLTVVGYGCHKICVAVDIVKNVPPRGSITWTSKEYCFD